MSANASVVCTARSWLFVPGNRPDRFSKALKAGADAVVIDLEDAVADADKDEARDVVVRTIEQGVLDGSVFLRLNALGSPFGSRDLAELARLGSLDGLSGVLLPKVEHADQVAAFRDRMGGHLPVVAIVETAQGLARVNSIAQADGVSRLVSGNLDLAEDLGCDFDTPGVRGHVEFPIVLASRVAGLPPPVEGPETQLGEPTVVEAAARAARALGFGAKICIHPSQVDAVHRGLRPPEGELARARRVLAAVGSAAPGRAIKVDGRMVDKPVIEWAKRIVQSTGENLDHI
ncbi:CoA ester lyase [Haloechinothrix salitolerans]|uniref:HpcH/HpaI aldolase/citrate lyase family protein n=1 Tax=Haloechinothrix salitolerans TaxID=926830 RepID=A0ABW2C610_9PSEU